MADQHEPSYLSRRILQAEVNRSIAEKLGSFNRDFGEVTKGMTEADAKAARLMILEMIRDAFDEFYIKMKARIEGQKG